MIIHAWYNISNALLLDVKTPRLRSVHKAFILCYPAFCYTVTKAIEAVAFNHYVTSHACSNNKLNYYLHVAY